VRDLDRHTHWEKDSHKYMKSVANWCCLKTLNSSNGF
jgi:hypothetical protein